MQVISTEVVIQCSSNFVTVVFFNDCQFVSQLLTVSLLIECTSFSYGSVKL